MRGVAMDTLGNIFVTGGSCGVGTGNDYATILYSSQGDLQWVMRYDNPDGSQDIPIGVVADGPGNVDISGRTTASTGPDFLIFPPPAHELFTFREALLG